MKKITYFLFLVSSFVYSQGVSSGLFFSQEEAGSSNFKKVIITFDAAPTKVNVNKAFYKYDKEFAFSFDLDDGLVGQYRVAMPMFNGGTVIYKDGNTPNYPGLFYTDGTGNNIPFSATLNVNMNLINKNANPVSNMNEFMLKNSYVKNFSLTNHSWSAQNQFTAPGFNSDPAIRDQQILFQITENYKKLKETLGVKVPNFTAPSNDPLYDPITIGLVESGYLKLVNNINNPGNEFGHSPNRYAEYWSTKKALGLSRDFDTWKDNTITRTARDFDFINTLLATAKLESNQHLWITLGTHRINLGEPETTNGGSMRYKSFKWVMEGLESNYGRYGADNMWMATIDAVYGYLKCVEKSSIVQSQNGSTVTLSIDFSEVDAEFREHSLSLLIDADTNITNIEYEGFDDYSHAINYKNLGNANALINIAYKPVYENAVTGRLGALVAVENLETTKSQTDLDTAQPLVSALRNGSYKYSLQARIDRVIVTPGAIVMQIDFGRSINGYELIYPWNSFTNTGIGVTVGSKLTNLSSTTSIQSGIDIEITAAFENYDANFSGVEGDPLANFPYEAERDCFKTLNGLTSTLRLTNLDETKLYDFTAFCSRNFIGTGTEITINGEKVVVGHKNNKYTLVSIANVVPNAGGILDIHIKGTGTNNVYGFLNILQITEKNP
ncbi:hypothetical protein [Polaribacter glomeratus]|uniref:Uncharacterized protein n=1 Tax=Polaribacter glomeratus TaxID=102 RepID=A0A2S7WWH3_9FLAO|nr:hypothetical protein [Polaribacter glomeratus]PQJ81721.1 hypothetical protein BTO16_03675 [Polaribacter glomeratus]TXD66354.1 hypothetical protein ESX12_06100 [Polaribacter glomeratus]